SDKTGFHPSSNSRRSQHNSVQSKARSWPQAKFATEPTTARYAHLAHDPLKQASDLVGTVITVRK
ncbi:MAG: hypothetical protein OEU92_34980, partial [Alphaproteobacteria bacterium]|nr:hypothetical protein [Alphaproteobacteria bacterium]